jgi:hypothetical protein
MWGAVDASGEKVSFYDILDATTDRGEWVSTSTYAKTVDNVTYDGKTYICKKDNTNIEPPNEEYWDLYDYLTLTINGTNLTNATFYFDRNANQYATEATISGESGTIYSDDYIWAMKWDTPVATKTITFKKWVRPSYNACLTSIGIELDELVFTKKWIDEVDSLAQSSDDNNGIFYGVLPNTGTIHLNDVNGELYDYAQDGYLDSSNYPITIWANGNQIQYHISSDVDYNYDEKTLDFELTNTLSNYEKTIFEGINAKTKVTHRENSDGSIIYTYDVTLYDILGLQEGEESIQIICLYLDRNYFIHTSNCPNG